MRGSMLVLFSWTLVLISTGCQAAKDANGLPTGPVTKQDLLARPESHLYYPGSRVIQSHAAGEVDRPLEGDFPAAVQTYLEVDGVTDQEVYGWYQAELTRSGWHKDKQVAEDVDYSRDTRETLVVAVFAGAPPGVPWDGRGKLYSIYYDIAPCSQEGVRC